MENVQVQEIYLKKCCLSALRENASSSIVDIKKLDVTNNTGTSKTVPFASSVSEIDFELTDLTVQDATLVPVTSSTPMQIRKNRQLT